MFDVDHFKRVNDTYGHDVGDRVLRAIGREAPSDGTIVGRLGGEEFAILLENSDLSGCRHYAEDLRAKMAALSFDTPLGQMSVTCSFGVAQWQPGEIIDRIPQARRCGALPSQARRPQPRRDGATARSRERRNAMVGPGPVGHSQRRWGTARRRGAGITASRSGHRVAAWRRGWHDFGFGFSFWQRA